MRIVVKVGTQSILSNEGSPLEATMVSLVEQIVNLQQDGHNIVLVSSGAVASGRNLVRQLLGREYGASTGEKQILASLGQHELVHIYSHMFRGHGVLASQILLTKQDFQTRQHYLNIARLLHEILRHKNIVTIINEHDSTVSEELMFADNDELAGLIAAQIDADKLIILSNVDGVYTGNPSDPGVRLIPLIDPQSRLSEKSWPEVSTTKSANGRGGMISKIGTARKMSELGIVTHIANIAQPMAIIRIVNGEVLGTTILAAKKKSGFKRWMAYSINQQNGSISINTCLFEILKENKRVLSILPVGIAECTGDFRKGDLVEILAPNGDKMGVGIARYDSCKLAEYCGKKEKPEFIHYDHLHIF